MNIIRRNDWCTTPATGTPSAIPTKLPRRWLHHGASGTSSIATANAYARWHIVGRPQPTWLDVGYSWLIAEGKVLEGRGPGRQGAHTRLDNDSSYGIVVCGDYRTREPSARDIDALVWLLRHGVSRGWWDTPAFTGGHRDAPQASTTCPGNRLHRLIPSINAAASKPVPKPVPEDVMAELSDEAQRYYQQAYERLVKDGTANPATPSFAFRTVAELRDAIKKVFSLS